MRINEALQAVAAGLRQQLSDAGLTENVESYPGEFTEAELRRVILKAPAVRVSVLSVDEVKAAGDGVQSLLVRFGAFVVAGDSKREARHVSALEITNEIIDGLIFERFGEADIMPAMPDAISAENLYSGEMDRQGVAVWGISWQQRIKA